MDQRKIEDVIRPLPAWQLKRLSQQYAKAARLAVIAGRPITARLVARSSAHYGFQALGFDVYEFENEGENE